MALYARRLRNVLFSRLSPLFPCHFAAWLISYRLKMSLRHCRFHFFLRRPVG